MNPITSTVAITGSSFGTMLDMSRTSTKGNLLPLISPILFLAEVELSQAMKN